MEAVLVIQILSTLADILYVCHHPLSKLDFVVVLHEIVVSVEHRHSHQEVGRLAFTAQKLVGRIFFLYQCPP